MPKSQEKSRTLVANQFLVADDVSENPNSHEMNPLHVTYIVRLNFAGGLDFYDPDSGARLSVSSLSFVQNEGSFEHILETIRTRQNRSWEIVLSTWFYQEVHAVPFGPNQCILHIKSDRRKQPVSDFQLLFSALPVPLWEMDCSQVLQYLRELNLPLNELETLLASGNELILRLASLVVVNQINAATLKLLRIGPDALLPNSILPFLCPESSAILKRILTSLLGEQSVLEAGPIRTISGEILHIVLQITPYPGSEQTWKRMLVVTQDVTPHYRAAAVLQERNNLIENVVASCPDLLWIKDIKARYLMANAATRATLFPGLAEQDLLGKTDREIAEELRNKAIRYTFGELCTRSDLLVMQHHEATTFVETGEIGDKHLSLEVTKVPFFDDRKQLVGTIGIGRDASRWQETEDSFRQQSHEFRLILENTNDGIWQFDRREGMFRANARFFAMIGYPVAHADEPVALREVLHRFIHPDDRSTFIEIFGLSAELQDYQRSRSLRLITQDGEHKWFSSRWTIAQSDLQGKPVRYLGIVTDITREKQREKEELQARLRAENLTRVKENFLSDMSHAIRTPLYGMLGMLQLLEGMITIPEQQHYLRTAVTAGRNLLCTINDVLDFTSMESGKLDLYPHPFRLRESLETLIETLQSGALDKKISLELYVAPAVPDNLFADRARLAQILFHLIGNAIKFTETGGARLDVDLIRQQENEVLLLLTVEDSGIGIPSSRLDEAVKPYTQFADPASHRPGTGLGLGIVKNLVQLMGGTLILDSEEGEGTTVTVTLPMRLEAPSTRPQQLLAMAAEKGKRVLVVEDDKISQLMLEAMIKKLGHSSSAASNGLTALKLLEKEHFDCILMDVQMPILDGLETTRRIRQGISGTSRNIPIIGLSAHAMSNERDRFVSLGMTDYLAKPVDIHLLGKMLANIRPEG